MNLQIILLCGLGGAVSLFCGDMLLYYDKGDYPSDGTLNPQINIMRKLKRGRLYSGGMIGPLAAFLYCIGFYHIVLITAPSQAILAWLTFLINSVAIIYGGSYHCYFANLGLIARHDRARALDEVVQFLNLQKRIAFGLQAIGFLLLTLLIGAGWTLLPQWMVGLTPLLLFALTPLVERLPKGIHVVVSGGWTNIVSIIYYLALLFVLIK